ncbi:GtrA family protein [Ktedonobacter robiniae]|uniref:GtrA family protein n=1 Tax=Ktedonobacter robiniae TaxID=2778365 RepID=UPI003B75C50D
MLVLLFSEQARPLRFLLTGGACGMLQLRLLALLAELNIESILANILALLLAAQVNFVLSNVFTWNDCPSIRTARRTLFRRWLRFHGSIAGTTLLNQGIFIIAWALLPILLPLDWRSAWLLSPILCLVTPWYSADDPAHLGSHSTGYWEFLPARPAGGRCTCLDA